jgi:hypothetical protein
MRIRITQVMPEGAVLNGEPWPAEGDEVDDCRPRRPRTWSRPASPRKSPTSRRPRSRKSRTKGGAVGKTILTNVRTFAVGARPHLQLQQDRAVVARSRPRRPRTTPPRATRSSWAGSPRRRSPVRGSGRPCDSTKVDDASWAQLGGVGPWSISANNGAAVGDLAYFTSALRCDYKLGDEVGEVAPWTSTRSRRGRWCAASSPTRPAPPAPRPARAPASTSVRSPRTSGCTPRCTSCLWPAPPRPSPPASSRPWTTRSPRPPRASRSPRRPPPAGRSCAPPGTAITDHLVAHRLDDLRHHALVPVRRLARRPVDPAHVPTARSVGPPSCPERGPVVPKMVLLAEYLSHQRQRPEHLHQEGRAHRRGRGEGRHQLRVARLEGSPRRAQVRRARLRVPPGLRRRRNSTRSCGRCWGRSCRSRCAPTRARHDVQPEVHRQHPDQRLEPAHRVGRRRGDRVAGLPHLGGRGPGDGLMASGGPPFGLGVETHHGLAALVRAIRAEEDGKQLRKELAANMREASSRGPPTGQEQHHGHGLPARVRHARPAPRSPGRSGPRSSSAAAGPAPA